MQLKVVRLVSPCACGFAAAIGIVLGGSTVGATTYYWNTSAGNGGSGVWDISGAQNWGTAQNTNSGLVNWSGSNSDTAEFYNGSGTVSVNNAQSAGNVNFDAGTAYTLSGGTINLGLNGINGNMVNSGNTTIAGAVVFGGVDGSFEYRGLAGRPPGHDQRRSGRIVDEPRRNRPRRHVQ